jgi:hypothetical protein
MKHSIGFLAIAALACAPLTAMAATLVAGEQYSLPADRGITGNLYVAAATTTVGGRVSGDVFGAGGSLTVTGPVGGDIAAVGGTVHVLGPVDGDIRIIGGTASLNSRVGGDVVAAGGTVHVLPGGIIAGDLLVAAGQVVIDGTVTGSVKVVGGTLTVNGAVRGSIDAKLNERLIIGSSATIAGGVTYRSPSQAVIDSGAKVGGQVVYVPLKGVQNVSQAPQRILWAVAGVVTGLRMLACLGLAALIVWRWRRQSLEIVSDVRNGFWRALGRGVVYLILVPIAAILLLISFVGTLPGVLLLMGYAAALILTKALAGILLGSVVVMVVRKQSVLHVTWGSALGGVIALALIGMIPFVGFIATAALWLSVFGVLAHRMQETVAR